MPMCVELFFSMRPSVVVWLLVTLVALTRGFPAPQIEKDGTSSSLPFIEFTKGGIKLNFGGYYAQAGLGGVFTSNKQDGGLHASAGTPDGTHAVAGLRGSLQSGPEGALYARATLGNGSRDDQTGLDSSLSGSPLQKIQYDDGSFKNERLNKGNVIEGVESIKHNKDVQMISSRISDNEQGPSSESSYNPGIKLGDSRDDYALVGKREHPAHWYFQKRLRERANIDLIKNNSDDSDGHDSPNIDTESINTQKNESSISQDFMRKHRPTALIRETAENEEKLNIEHNKKSKSTLFDDIFNIPISALNAVNQLLKNHVGKK